MNENQVTRIFANALELDGEPRGKYLDRACRHDAELRKEVESLLEAYHRPGLLLDNLAIDAVNTSDWDQALLGWEGRGAPGHERTEKRCPDGRHVFDPARFSSCPFCAPALDTTKIIGRSPDETKTLVLQPPLDSGLSSGDVDQRKSSPVVGWLVCVEGADRGRDYRIRSHRNSIGRDALMDVCIAGDPRVSRQEHAVVTHDPMSNSFRIAPGGSRSLAYLNGELLDRLVSLKAYDMIELGETRLVFLPLCGDQFTWE